MKVDDAGRLPGGLFFAANNLVHPFARRFVFTMKACTFRACRAGITIV